MAVATPLTVRIREGKPGGGKGPLISEDKSLTLGCANDQTVLTPTMTVRRLTPLECERLMGWPDNWTAGQSDTHRYKQCGNGVASPVAEWIGRQLINLHQDTSLLL
jgi:DNA (cytosine-5)-methyltransferase 1